MGYTLAKKLNLDRNKNLIEFECKQNNDDEPFRKSEFMQGSKYSFDEKYAKLILIVVNGYIQFADKNQLKDLECTHQILEGYINSIGELGYLGAYKKYEKDITEIVGKKLDINTEEVEEQQNIKQSDIVEFLKYEDHDEGFDFLQLYYPNNVMLNRINLYRFQSMKGDKESTIKYEQEVEKFNNKYNIDYEKNKNIEGEELC